MAVSQLKMLLGFSRVAQASLSVAQPFAAALIALHGFPPIDRLLLGLSAAWAGFLAVFALNDLLDIEMDRVRFAHLRGYDDFDLDSAMVRHPLAQEQLSFGLGAAWVGGVSYLRPGCCIYVESYSGRNVCPGSLAQAIYCKLAGVTLSNSRQRCNGWGRCPRWLDSNDQRGSAWVHSGLSMDGSVRWEGGTSPALADVEGTRG